MPIVYIIQVDSELRQSQIPKCKYSMIWTTNEDRGKEWWLNSKDICMDLHVLLIASNKFLRQVGSHIVQSESQIVKHRDSVQTIEFPKYLFH